MKVVPITQIKNNIYYGKSEPCNNERIINKNNSACEVVPNFYYPLIFTGNVAATKSFLVKINNNKLALLRRLDEILKTKPKDLKGIDLDFIAEYCAEKVYSTIEALNNRLKSLEDDIQQIANNNTLKSMQKRSLILNKNNQFQELSNKCKKIINNFEEEVNKRMLNEIYGSQTAEENYDYELINKFKCAIKEDDYDLEKIFVEHYASLSTIKTIDELKEKFPKIKLPPRPEEVITKKIMDVLPRDFYLEMAKYVENNNIHAISDLICGRLVPILKELAEKDCRIEYVATERFIDIFTSAVADNYKKLVAENKLNTIPQSRKLNLPDISDLDYKMLSIDYDDFILSVIKAIYFKGVKPSNIKYKCDDIIINISDLRNTEYKFEKISERIKRIIKDAEEIKNGYRSYDRFSAIDFKERFNFYANTQISDNDTILETIIEFQDCPLSEADFGPAKRLLKEFDKVIDGESSVEKVVKLIESESIIPQNRKSLNQKELEEQRKKQEITQMIKEINLKLENAVNTLYSNEFNSVAQICEKYKIEKLDNEKIEYINIIADIVKNNLGTISGLNIIKNSILNLETYKNAIDAATKSPHFSDAIKYATENGVLDKLKAGQYLRNAQKFLENNYRHAESSLIDILKGLSTVNNNDKIIGLCKYEDFITSQKENECSILDALSLFNKKNILGKNILNYIIENDYVNKDTTVIIKNATRGNANKAVIKSSAKQQILDKYKTTGCIDIYEAFEEAAGMYARQSGTAGIKLLTSNNNKLQYEMELKIYRGRTTNRLFSSNNDYVFDIFDTEGLH